MAEVKVNRESSSQQQSPEQRQSGAVSRRGEFTPSILSLDPRDFFTMSPFQLMRRFSEDVDRMFAGGGEQGVWAPTIEVKQQGDNLRVCAELPGLNKDDVKVEITDQGLVLQGERKREHEQKNEGYYRSERSYGQFYRLIPLPEDAKVDQAKAQFNNGILDITIPVPQAQRKRREIPIEGEAKTRTSGGGA